MSGPRSDRWLVMAGLALSALAAPASAGSFRGTITDQQAQLLVNIAITIEALNLDGSRLYAGTTRNGTYAFSISDNSLAPHDKSIGLRFSAQGRQTITLESVLGIGNQQVSVVMPPAYTGAPVTCPPPPETCPMLYDMCYPYCPPPWRERRLFRCWRR